MKKMAVFVEGQTERVFVEYLIAAMADGRRLSMDIRRFSGGRRHRRFWMECRLSLVQKIDDPEYYFLIYDCGTDGRVVSDINDNYESMVEAGYSVIVGVRDVGSDFTYEERSDLMAGLCRTVSSDVIPTRIVLATMETEAWFLAEHTHLRKICSSLTTERIRSELGIDLLNDNLEMRPKPSDDLHTIYMLADLTWSKSLEDVKRTVSALDFDSVNGPLCDRVPSIKPLVEVLTDFF